MRFVVPLALGFTAAIACATSSFVCAGDDDCSDGARQGSCEPDGFCSFPDADCPSGARYGEHAGDGLAGTCVDGSSASSDPGSDGASGDPSTTASSTTLDPSATAVDDAGVCGDGIVDPGEDCDGDALDGATCISVGFWTGTLACRADCTFDTSVCTNCGNGALDADEACDGDGPSGIECGAFGLGEGEVTCNGCMPVFDGCTAPMCGVDPTAPLFPCPEECSSCAGDVCTIDCLGPQSCAAGSIDCPEGWPCQVRCGGTGSCSDSTLSCPELFACTVDCSGVDACNDMTVSCSEFGACDLTCATTFGACAGARLQCGTDVCTASCGLGMAAAPTVECSPAAACECTPCPD